MSCCTPSGTGKFFNESAGYYAWRFRRRGVDRPQKIIVQALKTIGLASRTILEVGCGTGGLHLTLLKDGASSAFGSELSEGMIARAKELAATMGLADRVGYLLGDFAVSNGSVPISDIVILDKVLCCYPDPESLLSKASDKCRNVLVVSYPREALLPRWLFGAQEIIGKLFRWSFTAIYHEPARLDREIENLGFSESFVDCTLIWQVKVFLRSNIEMKW